MSFDNPIVGGGGDLVREQVRSPNYVTGVSGWIIRRDGSAEFGQAIIRGVLQTGSPGAKRIVIDGTGADGNKILFYSGDPSETAPGYVAVDDPGSDVSLELAAPELSGADRPTLTLTSGAVLADSAVAIFSPGSVSISADVAELAASGLVQISGDTLDLSSVSGIDLDAGNGDISVTGDLTWTGDYVGRTRYIRATAVENVNNSNVLQTDNELTASVVPGAIYEVEFFLFFNTAVNCDLRTDWSVPALATGLRGALGATQTAAAFTSRLNTAAQVRGAAFASVPIYQIDAGGVDQLVYERGLVITDANGGSVTLRWCQDVPTVGNLTRQINSFMKITRAV